MGRTNVPLRRVLLLAFHFPPDNASGAARPNRFFQYLPEFGYQPEVITAASSPNPLAHVHFVPAPTRSPNRRTAAGLREMVLRKFVFPNDEGVLWADSAARFAGALHRSEPVAAVISTFPPVNTHLAALRLKQRYRLPWIADFRDPMLGNPFRSSDYMAGVAAQFLEPRIFRKADAILSVTDVISENWRRQYPQHADKIHTLWNGFDPSERISPLPIPPRQARVMAHVGNLYGFRHPAFVLASVQRLLERSFLAPGQVRVHLVGELDEDIRRAHAELFADLETRQAIEYTNSLPRPEALRIMGEADYLLLVDMVGGGGYAVPAKLFEYLRIGRPILAVTPRNSPVERILESSKVPYRTVHPDDDPARVDEQVLQLLQLPSEPVAPSAWFEETFDGRRQTAAVARLLDTLTGTR
jgi:glycosyltransferase involved in cell wall biosynthesis